MPAAPPPVLAPRRTSRKIKVGKVEVGGDAPVCVQSMTHDADHRHQRDAAADRRAHRVRLRHRAGRLPEPGRRRRAARDRPQVQIPVIADIHFQPKYVFAAIDAGCAAVRVNPGNIRKFDDQVERDRRGAPRTPASRSGSASTPARSTRACCEKYGKATPEALVESAVWEASLFEEHDFHDFKISVKHNDPVVMVQRLRAARRARRLAAAPRRHRGRPGVPGHHQVGHRLRRAALARASATPSGSRCRRRRSRRSRSASRSCSRSTCARASSRSSPARRAAAPRSTSTSSPTRSPPGSRA